MTITTSNGTTSHGTTATAVTTRPTRPSAPPAPRLRMEPTGSTRTLLDGGWWPRSTDPAAELPGLVLAIDKVRGRVTGLVLSAEGWDNHPRRLDLAGRVVRLGYFTSQPTALMTARCDNDNRVDLLVVPPDVAGGTADAAMVLAATASNLVHAEHLLAAVASTSTPRTSTPGRLPEQVGTRL